MYFIEYLVRVACCQTFPCAKGIHGVSNYYTHVLCKLESLECSAENPPSVRTCVCTALLAAWLQIDYVSTSNHVLEA